MLLTGRDTGTGATARRCGYADDERLRKALIRHLGIPPTITRFWRQSATP